MFPQPGVAEEQIEYEFPSDCSLRLPSWQYDKICLFCYTILFARNYCAIKIETSVFEAPFQLLQNRSQKLMGNKEAYCQGFEDHLLWF